MKNEKNERRYVITEKPVDMSKKKWLKNMPMVTVYDTEREVEFAVEVKTGTKLLGDKMCKFTYVRFPNGMSEVVDIIETYELNAVDTISKGQLIRLFNDSPYVYE